jgi:hypothetical protein
MLTYHLPHLRRQNRTRLSLLTYGMLKPIMKQKCFRPDVSWVNERRMYILPMPEAYTERIHDFQTVRLIYDTTIDCSNF